MGDDDVTSAERRLRAVLQPDDERVRHVIAGALSPDRQIHPLRPLGLLAACVVAVVALLVVVQLWRASAPLPPALHISGTGSVVVVTSDDGKRWIVNVRHESTARGEYVIAFPR
jgi:hypothetical protein